MRQRRCTLTMHTVPPVRIRWNQSIPEYKEQVIHMHKRYLRRIAAVTAAVALTIAGAAYAAGNARKNAVLPTGTAAAGQQVVILDAGHGGMDGGCSSAAGDVEKNINLAILLDLRELLQASGYTVIVTRDTDTSIHDPGIEGIANQKSSDMDNRLAIFNSAEDAVCISIHQNQFTDPQYSGAQMFYSDTNPESAALAQTLQDQFVAFLQPENRREIKLCGKELFLCYYSENPTVMAECGFLSNPEEAALLVTEEYQRKVAFTIYAALVQYFAAP